MAVSLRLARSGDVEAIRAIARAAYAPYVERMDREPAPMLADYAALVRRGAVTVADEGGGLAGIVVCYPRGNAFHVENVAIAPGFQRRGLGTLLMDHAEAQATKAGLSSIELYTNEAMTENIPFYEGRGYVIHERAEQDGYARIFFRKELN